MGRAHRPVSLLRPSRGEPIVMVRPGVGPSDANLRVRADFACFIRLIAPSAEAKVPPEKVPDIRTWPRTSMG